MSTPMTADPPAWIHDLFLQADAARRAGRYALALAIYRRVVAAEPRHAAALQHLGVTLNILGRRGEAEAALRQALSLSPHDPAARHGLAIALLGQGRYPEAGPFYQARFDLPEIGQMKPVDFPFPEWAGEDLAGKRLVVFPEMGFGDQIQFARFAAILRDRGAEVWLLCLPDLVRLLADSLPGVHVAAAEGRTNFPDPDYWTTSGSLMFLAGAAPESLPRGPYLRASRAPFTLPAGFKVGLMTAGNPAHGNDANRSLTSTEAAALRAALPGRVIDLSPAATGARDFADTAALLDQLDLVVTVDTSLAHLAGGLGKRAFVLIPGVNTDWRWMHERQDSPWYPSLRLYRADPRAGWAPALAALAKDAQAEAAAAQANRP